MNIQIENQGQDIISSNYWGSDIEKQRLLFLSPNAGAIRLLVPRNYEAELQDMTKDCDYVIVTRGKWNGAEAVEILFENHSHTPYSITLTADSCLMLPGNPGSDRQWGFAIWTLDETTNRPIKRYAFKSKWRRADELPYLRPWEE